MDEPPKKMMKPGVKKALVILLAVVVVGIFAFVSMTKFELENMDTGEVTCIGFGCQANTKPRKSALAGHAVGAMSKLQTPADAPPATAYRFRDATGAEIGFDAFRGKVAVINLWALWCAPCREEMPTLAALSAAYAANPDVVVAPISVDLPEKVEDARAFITDHAPLAFYSDPTFRLPFEFEGKGAMPQTIVLDRQGRVRAYLTGGADWSSAETKALIDALLAEK